MHSPDSFCARNIFSVLRHYLVIWELNHTNKGKMTGPGHLYPPPFPMAVPAAKVLTKVERSAVICGRCALL